MDKKLLLFLILLFGLALCSVLGGYSCIKEGFDSDKSNDYNQPPSDPSNNPPPPPPSDPSNNPQPPPPPSDITTKSFYGPNGGTAKVVYMNGVYYIRVTDQTGTSTNYTDNNHETEDNIYMTTFIGENGGVARVINNNGSYIIEITYPSGEVLVFTQNTAGIYNPNSPNPSQKIISVDPTLSNGGQYPSSSTSAFYYPSQPPPNSSGQYNSTMPPGVPASQIPPGDEDLYILKSQVITPVCPACPSSSTCPKAEKAPPCPACARCPESNFECKKVPNYNSINDQFLPMPVLNSFSTFGM